MTSGQESCATLSAAVCRSLSFEEIHCRRFQGKKRSNRLSKPGDIYHRAFLRCNGQAEAVVEPGYCRSMPSLYLS